MEPLEDRDLVRLAVSGETWAFGRLVERHGGLVFARIRRIVRQPDDAEDLAQEVFLQAFRRLGQLRDGSRFSHWLLKIADNAAVKWCRRRMVQVRFERLLTEEWRELAFDDSGAEREARMMIRQAIRRLSEAHRDVIEKHYFEGRSYAETAYQLGLQVNTVRSRLQKARQRIRKEMSEMTGTLQTDIRSYRTGSSCPPLGDPVREQRRNPPYTLRGLPGYGRTCDRNGWRKVAAAHARRGRRTWKSR